MVSTMADLRIRAWVSEHSELILTLVANLVKFQTVNLVIDGTEAECQQYVAQYMKDMGLEVDLFSPEDVPGFHEHPAYFPGKDYTHRPNVIGRWAGKGAGKSLIFASHVDTAVVADGWQESPWNPVVKDNKLYGLGSFDMKGGLAASIMAIRCLQDLGVAVAGDVIIESVVDEEFGGANGTLACRVKGIAADAAIIPEPTNLAVCPATRGGALWRVTFRGTTGLSFSGEKMINPVTTAAHFITYLEQFEQERSAQIGPSPWYDQPGQGELPVIVTRVEAGDMDAALNDAGPTQCFVDIWVECHPNVSEEELQEELMSGFRMKHSELVADEKYAPTFEKVIRFLPGCELDPSFPLIDQLAEVATAVTGQTTLVQGAPFACDAFMFNVHSSTPAIVFGPKGANAHAPEEYIDIPNFVLLVIFVRNGI